MAALNGWRKQVYAYLLLTRISLAPSALVDALVGLTLGTAGVGPGWRIALIACAASLCAFLGGMALNDWADREEDAKTRPERPLPSGALSPAAAGCFAFALLGTASALAFWIGQLPGLMLTGVVVCAASYDLFLRGAHLGPVCLGACRAGNLSFGILAGLAATGREPEAAFFLPALGYGLYVWILSRLSAFEDGAASLEGSAKQRPTLYLRAAAVWLACLPATAFALRPAAPAWAVALAFGISFSAAWGLWQLAKSTRDWTAPLVGRAMGACLRRMMLATTSLACMAWHGEPFGFVAIVIGLGGLKIAHQLRLRFPPS